MHVRQAGVVTEINGERAKFLVEMFGALREVETDAGNLAGLKAAGIRAHRCSC